MTLEMGQLWHSLGALGSALALRAPQKWWRASLGLGGKGRVALPFLQLHGEGEVCDSPRSYLIHYDEAGV